MIPKKFKSKGSDHYKTGDVEPLDLFYAGGFLKEFCIASIIKYAFRNTKTTINPEDMEKIIHYTEILKWVGKDEEVK